MAKRAQKKAPSKTASKAQQRQAYMEAVKRTKPFTMLETDKKVVVSFGYGTAFEGRLHKFFKPAEWSEVRVDQDKKTKPDIQTSLHNVEMLKDASVDGVWLGHVLQRLPFHRARAVVDEAMRVLKEDGVFLAAVPDAQLAATYLANGEFEKAVYTAPAGSVTALDLLYGFQKSIEKGDLTSHHLSGYTPESFGIFLRGAGVCNLNMQRQHVDIYALGKKLPYGHPERVERIVMQKVDAGSHPKAPPIKASGAQQAVRYLDRLEDDPQLWKPLRLKKA